MRSTPPPPRQHETHTHTLKTCAACDARARERVLKPTFSENKLIPIVMLMAVVGRVGTVVQAIGSVV